MVASMNDPPEFTRRPPPRILLCRPPTFARLPAAVAEAVQPRVSRRWLRENPRRSTYFALPSAPSRVGAVSSAPWSPPVRPICPPSGFRCVGPARRSPESVRSPDNEMVAAAAER